MNNEFSFEITNESKNAINKILKQQGLRHFKLYTDFYGELDVINYEEYQKLEKEKDKEIERLSKEVDMWNRKYNEQIDIINELEELLENPYNVDCINQNNDFLRRIKELKEDKNE